MRHEVEAALYIIESMTGFSNVSRVRPSETLQARLLFITPGHKHLTKASSGGSLGLPAETQAARIDASMQLEVS